jgi:hypothetical protein
MILEHKYFLVQMSTFAEAFLVKPTNSAAACHVFLAVCIFALFKEPRLL